MIYTLKNTHFYFQMYDFSRDCPIFYMRVKSRMDMGAKLKRIQRFGVPEW